MVTRTELGALGHGQTGVNMGGSSPFALWRFFSEAVFWQPQSMSGAGGWTAILLAIASASIVNYLGSAFFVFPPAEFSRLRRGAMASRRAWVTAILPRNRPAVAITIKSQ